MYYYCLPLLHSTAAGSTPAPVVIHFSAENIKVNIITQQLRAIGDEKSQRPQQ